MKMRAARTPPRRASRLGDNTRRFHILRAMSPGGTSKCHLASCGPSPQLDASGFAN
jgi:hypothetical protein